MSFYLRHSIGFFLQIFPSAILFFIPFRDDLYRFTKKWTMVILAVLAIVTSTCFPLSQCRTITDLFGSVNLPANIYMSVILIMLVFFMFISIRETPIKKMLVICLVVFYASTQYLMVNLFSSAFDNEMLTEVFSTPYFILYIVTLVGLFPVTAVLMHRYVYRYMQEIENNNMKTEFKWIVNISLFSILMMVIYNSIPIINIQDKWVVFGPLFILITIVLLRLYYTFFEESIARKSEEERKRQLEISRVQYQNITNEIDKTRSIRHDMRHHLRSIYDMAGKGKSEEIREYISTLIDVTDKNTAVDYCRNKTINGLLQYYIGGAEQKNIICRVNAVCDEVGIDDTDLTVIIGNVFENAICSCEKSKMTGNITNADSFNPARKKHNKDSQKEKESNQISPRIYVDIGVLGSALMIQVQNTCTKVIPTGKYKINEEFVPAAAFMSGYKNGGIGLRSLENTAARYGGEALFRYDDNKKLFVTRIRLNFHPEIL